MSRPPPSDQPPARSADAGPPFDPDDEDVEIIYETLLPLRPEEMTASQARLMERVAAHKARTSPAIRCRRRVFSAVGGLAAILVGLGIITLFVVATGAVACASACVAIPVATGVVSLLFERHVWRPVRWSLEPWTCPGCGYNLEGLATRDRLICPECGAASDLESRRRLALDTAAVLAEVRENQQDLSWAVKRNPRLARLGARECAEILEHAVNTTRRPLRDRLRTAAAVVLGLLLVAGGLFLVGLGLVKGSWHETWGVLPLALGSILLLRSSEPRRRRMAAAIADALPPAQSPPALPAGPADTANDTA